jgi:hypothetical protein
MEEKVFGKEPPVITKNSLIKKMGRTTKKKNTNKIK